MGFRFQLATLLRLREISEEREERSLGRLLSEMAQVRHSIIDMETRKRDLLEARERSLGSLMTSAELQSCYREVSSLEKIQVETGEQLSKLELLRVEQLRKYELAHSDREALSGMRGDQLDTYRTEQIRKEQSAMDDNFSSRKSPV